MAILVDMSQVILSNLFAQVRPGEDFQEDLIRHMVLNSIHSYKLKFESKYGRLILCFDNSKRYWRKNFFPFYKHHRKKDREESGFDWSKIFDTLHLVRDELILYMPFQVLQVDEAEADDIIGVLTKELHKKEKILIISGDKDFGQLQKYPNVAQWSSNPGGFIKIEDPVKFLRHHIMVGDRGDGIPNMLSADNVFAEGIRQKTMPRATELEKWECLPPEKFCTSDMMVGWKRNEILIDLEKIPKTVQDNIMKAYSKPFDSSNSRMFEYFMKMKLKRLLTEIETFKVKQYGQSLVNAGNF